MTALVVLLAVVVCVQTVLVAGLLRSHAVILRRLHELGAGVGDPAGAPEPRRNGDAVAPPVAATAAATGRPAADIVGTDPAGDALALRIVDVPHMTVLAFLSSTCLTCARFWEDLRRPSGVALPEDARLVIVTKGAEAESPAAMADLAPARFTTVLCSRAWDDYEVPGSPYVVAVDGPGGRVVGEGTGSSWDQVAALLAQATGDIEWSAGDRRAPRARRRRSGAEREADIDAALLAAGIGPGDPRLHESLEGSIRNPDTSPEPPR